MIASSLIMTRALFILMFCIVGSVAVMRCHVKTKTKCYHVVIRPTRSIDYASAEKMCKRQNFDVANIPSQEVYDAVVEIMRTKFPQKNARENKKVVYAWTAMKVDPERGVITEPDRDAFRKWNWYRPRLVPGWSNVFLNVRAEGIPYQGMDNTFAEDKTNGVICVKDI